MSSVQKTSIGPTSQPASLRSEAGDGREDQAGRGRASPTRQHAVLRSRSPSPGGGAASMAARPASPTLPARAAPGETELGGLRVSSSSLKDWGRGDAPSNVRSAFS
jgi:hypothetical protein